MSWKEFFLNLAHDYKPVVLAFVAGWHIRRPKWMRGDKPE